MTDETLIPLEIPGYGWNRQSEVYINLEDGGTLTYEEAAALFGPFTFDRFSTGYANLTNDEFADRCHQLDESAARIVRTAPSKPSS